MKTRQHEGAASQVGVIINWNAVREKGPSKEEQGGIQAKLHVDTFAAKKTIKNAAAECMQHA
jgi:hypothetical protein